MLNFLQHNFSISFQIFFFLWLCEIILKSFIFALLPPSFCPSLLLYSPGLKVIIFGISQTFSSLACFSLPYCVSAHHFEGWSQQQVYLWQWLCMWGNQPILKKKKTIPRNLFLKASGWILQTIFRSCPSRYPNILLLLWMLLIRLILSLVVMVFISQSKQRH